MLKKKAINFLDVNVRLVAGELITDLFVKSTDTHQFLDPSSSHPYHCKKGISYSQALRLNRISSDNERFDKRCNVLGWLMEREYNGKMIRKQILKAREHSRKDLLEREKEKTSEPRLTFNITYYPDFKTIRNILQELHLLSLTPDKEHKKVFPDVAVVGFRNGKSLKDYLVRAALPKTNETGRCEPFGKKTCLVCNSIRITTTFTTEACGEVFKIWSCALTCNSEKVLYLLKCKVCGKAPYVGKAKTKFRYRFNNYKSKHRAFTRGNKKIPQKRFHDHYCLDDHLGIDDWDFSLFEQCETHN